MKALKLSIGVLLMVSSACLPKSRRGDISTPHYIPFQSASQCAFTYGYYPELKFCVRNGGTSEAAVERQKRYIAVAVSKWMDALRQDDPRLTNQVSFTCSAAHFQVTVNPGSGTAMSGCGEASLYSYESTGSDSGEDPVLQGTTLHELGHGLAGLNDTYSGRQAGACQPGQPESIMCWGGYGQKRDEKGLKTLYDDDIAGIRDQFQRLKQYMKTPPGGIPPAGTIPPNGNVPGTGEPPIAQDLFAALAPVSASGTQTLFISTSARDIRASVCDLNSVSSCPDPFVDTTAACRPQPNIGDRFIHARSNIALVPNTTYTVILWRAQGQAIGLRKFQIRRK